MHRASRNDKELLALRRDKPYSNQSPKMFYGPQQKLTAIRDVLPTEKVSCSCLLLSNFPFHSTACYKSDNTILILKGFVGQVHVLF